MFRLIGLGVFIGAVATFVAWDQFYRPSAEEYATSNKLAQFICNLRTAETPEREFSSDGCTLFPNAFGASTNYAHCCVRHDVDYYCGGTLEDRAVADTAFRECVRGVQPIAGTIMYYSSRAFSHPMFPAPWRWGYGFDYPRGYNGPHSTKATTTAEADDVE